MRINNKAMMNNSNTKGFSLIELMIAAAIIAILSSVAYSFYNSSVIKARRAEGKTAILQLMQQEERFYTQNSTYISFSQASTDANEKKFKWFSSNSAVSSSYELSGAACSGDTIQNCVVVTAKPGTANVNGTFTDSECNYLTMTSTGVKGISGNGNADKCW